MCRTADFTSLDDSNDNNDLTAPSRLPYTASWFYFQCLHLLCCLSIYRSVLVPPLELPNPAIPLRLSHCLSLPYTHSHSTRAIQSVFCPYILHAFSRLLTFYFFFSLTSFAMPARVLCTPLCVCSPAFSTPWNVIVCSSLPFIL